MTAYYSEFDPYKAEVLREAIKAGAIAPGDVDERSITDVTPADLLGYTQVHCFAGGGFWSLALRQAGWPDDREVWTGSCPCPSFSAAGKQLGFRDPRHLWPAWFRLIRKCKPQCLFGEQVANAIGHGWLDLISTDVEREGYAVGSVVFGAHSVGAPHIRQRLYFVAEPQHAERWPKLQEHGNTYRRNGSGRSSDTSRMDHSASPRCEPTLGNAEGTPRDKTRLRGLSPGCEDVRMGDASFPRLQEQFLNGGVPRKTMEPSSRQTSERRSLPIRTGPLNGFWRDADWIGCRDGKFRPVKSGTFPLATSYPGRVGLLRLAGDAICVETAKAFVETYLDVEEELILRQDLFS